MNTKRIISALVISALLWSNVSGLVLARESRDNEWYSSHSGRATWTFVDYDNQSGLQSSSITPRPIRGQRAQMLSPKDQETINSRINSVPVIDRLDFLLTVLARAEALRTSIEASSRTPAQKTRLLGLLDDVVNIIQDRISTDIANQANQATDDHTAPTTSTFSVSGITRDSSVISLTSNEAGKVYFVILPSGSPMPTPAQIKAGQNAAGQTGAISGFSAMNIGINQFSVTGLAPSTSYTVYFVAEDTFENLQGMVTSSSFTTLATGSGTGTGTTGTGTDTTAPVTSALSLTGITSSGAMLQLTSSESGTIYGVTLMSGASAPTPAQVKAGQDASWSAVSLSNTFPLTMGSNQYNLTGFAPVTNYTLYLVAQDTTGNLQSTVMSQPFTTPQTGTGTTGTGTTGTGTDTTAPAISGESLMGITSSGAMLQLTSSESGTVHTVILPSGSTVPTVAQVRAGQDATGAQVTLHMAFTATTGSNQFSLSGLVPATSYTVYFVAEDATGNRETSVHSLSLMTTP